MQPIFIDGVKKGSAAGSLDLPQKQGTLNADDPKIEIVFSTDEIIGTETYDDTIELRIRLSPSEDGTSMRYNIKIYK